MRARAPTETTCPARRSRDMRAGTSRRLPTKPARSCAAGATAVRAGTASRPARRTLNRSARVAGRQDVPKREREDSKVEPGRPMFDVVQVVLYPQRDVGVAAQVVHLCPAGDAGLHQVLLHVSGDGVAEFLDELGSF